MKPMVRCAERANETTKKYFLVVLSTAHRHHLPILLSQAPPRSLQREICAGPVVVNLRNGSGHFSDFWSEFFELWDFSFRKQGGSSISNANHEELLG